MNDQAARGDHRAMSATEPSCRRPGMVVSSK